MTSILAKGLSEFAKDEHTSKRDIEVVVSRMFGIDAGFDKDDQPREKNGRFAKGSGGGLSSVESQSKSSEQEQKVETSILSPMNPVYGTNKPLNGGKSLLTSSPKSRTISRPTYSVKKQKVSKQEYARLTSHAMQYMTPEQRNASVVTLEKGGTKYLVEKDADYNIKRILKKWKTPMERGKE